MKLFAAAAPALFVFLWSTGFIGARYGLPYAEPLTFLSLRFVIVIALLAIAVALSNARLPRTRAMWGHLAISGVLIHLTYLGGLFYAMWRGLDAGMAALIAGVQPLLTALIAGPLLGERLNRVHWLGLAVGFVGLTLVLARARALGDLPPAALVAAVIALFGITLGTLYQKRFVHDVDLLAGSLVQFSAALVPALAIALYFEDGAIEWTGEFIFALAWLCLVLSLGAISVLWYLIRVGGASRVASLFYLVPPATALEAYFLFDERLTPVQMIGIALTALGVALINRPVISRDSAP